MRSRRKQQQGRSPSSSSSSFSSSSISKSPSSRYFLEAAMLRHTLLTKEQEHALGRKIQRAHLVRSQVIPLILQYKNHPPSSSSSSSSPPSSLVSPSPLFDTLVQEQPGQYQYHDEDDDEEEEDDEDERENKNRLVTDLSSFQLSSSSSSIYNVRSYADDEQFQTLQHLRFLQSKETRLSTQEDSVITTSSSSLSKQQSTFLLDDLDWHLLTQADLALFGGRDAFVQILVTGSAARQILIRHNIRLVMSIGKKWCGQQQQQARTRNSYNSRAAAQGFPYSSSAVYKGGWDRPSLDEVVQEGILGLAQAVDKFEPDRDLRFATYATFWITNSIRICFQQSLTGPLRLPARYHTLQRNFRQVMNRCRDAGEKEPCLEEVAEELGVSALLLLQVLRMTRSLQSTDAPLMNGNFGAAGKSGTTGNEPNGVALSETLVDDWDKPIEEQIELSFLRSSLERALATELFPHERDILRLRLGLDDGVARTMREVAEELDDLTVSEVSMWEKRAFKKLRSPRALATYKLLTYLNVADIDGSSITLF